MPKKTKTRKEHHVVPNSQGGWDIKKPGGKKSIKHSPTKEEAVNVARKISKKQKTELVIHDKKGKIQRKDSHGNDPYPPKG